MKYHKIMREEIEDWHAYYIPGNCDMKMNVLVAYLIPMVIIIIVFVYVYNIASLAIRHLVYVIFKQQASGTYSRCVREEMNP